MSNPSYILTPVNPQSRIESLDILRGIAVLGIVIMNVQSFAMPEAAYLNPNAYERLTGPDLWVWLLSHVFANQKFMAIFSMLFGASIIMLSQKAQKEHLRSTDLQYKRFIFLGIFGMIHAYLIWYGDILLPYAICGLLLYIFRRKKTRVQIRAGIIFLLIGSGISLLIGYTVPFWEEAELQSTIDSSWMPTQEMIAAEINAYHNVWERQVLFRAPRAFEMQTTVFVFESFWRIAGMMLIGMALYKRKVFKAARSSKYYTKMIFYGFGLGLPLVLAGVYFNFENQWQFQSSFFFLSQLNYWGSIGVALGYIGLIMLLCKQSTRTFVAKRFSDVGRMALSNYLMQSILMGIIFYGHGFALFGTVDRTTQAFTVMGVWIFCFVFSGIWLYFFRYGPFEWLWRTLTYGKLQPLER